MRIFNKINAVLIVDAFKVFLQSASISHTVHLITWSLKSQKVGFLGYVVVRIRTFSR